MDIDKDFLCFITNHNTLKVLAGLLIGVIIFLVFMKLSDKRNKIELVGLGLFFGGLFPLLAFSVLVMKSIVLSVVFVFILWISIYRF